MNRFPSASDNADYAERERVRGAREIPSPPPLPDFPYTPTAQAARAIPPPTATERAEARARYAEDSVESRMTRAQLADRIRQMEATTEQKAQAAHTARNIARERGTDYTAPEKPGATIARADKLRRYREELTRRDEAARKTDEAAMRENARIDALTQRNTTAQAAAAEAAPELVVCGTCGLLIGQDAEGDMQSHLNRQMIECPAPPTNWRRHRTNPRFADQIAKPVLAAHAETEARDLDDAQREQTAQAQARTAKCNAQGCSSQTYDAQGLCSFHRAEYDAASARMEARALAEAAQAIAAEPPPVPPAAAAAIAKATKRRIAVVADARAETLSALDAAVEALVREHTSGAVIDAAWAAAARIFRPGQTR